MQPGTYTGSITWPGIAGIKLLSAGDTSNTTISGNNLAAVMTFTTGTIDTNTVIRGFKITDGYETGSAVELRENYDAVQPGYHMNKKHWNTIDISTGLPDDLILKFIDDSYNLVFKRLR